jgi:hypothetical protein
MTDTASTAVIRTLLRKANAEYRPREYLTGAEAEKLIEAARKREGMEPAMLARYCSRTGMGCGRKSYARCNGRRLI